MENDQGEVVKQNLRMANSEHSGTFIFILRRVGARKMQEVLTGVIKPVERVLILFPQGCSGNHELEFPRAGEAKVYLVCVSRISCNGLSIW